MKLLKLVGVLFVVVIACTGCYNPGKNTPENLLNELPIYNTDNKNLSDEVNRILGSATLVLPDNSTEIGKINRIDIDNDDKNEVVFFQKKESLNEKVGFTILDYNRGEQTDYIYNELGTDIKYANFCDLNKDGKREIIMLVENESATTITISSYHDGKIDTIISKENYNYFKKDGYENLNLLIQDINNDKILDLVIYGYNYKTKTMKIAVVNLDENNLKVLDEIEFENVKSFDSINIVVGNINSTQKGMFLSYQNSKNNDYTTQLVYLDNNVFVDALKDYEQGISNSYYVRFRDINNDGIMNIPVVNSVTSDALNTNITKSSATISWKKYNCKVGKEANLLFQIQIYYNYENNFKFLIPNNLTGKIYVSEQKTTLGSRSKIFNFYYYSIGEQNSKKLFTITLIEKNIPADTKNLSNAKHILDTDKYGIYLGEYNDEELKKFDLNADIIQGYFSKIED